MIAWTCSRRGTTPTFPKPIKLGASAIGWIDSEITTWIEQRMSAKEAC